MNSEALAEELGMPASDLARLSVNWVLKHRDILPRGSRGASAQGARARDGRAFGVGGRDGVEPWRVLHSGAGLGDLLREQVGKETEEQRKKRMQQMAQQFGSGNLREGVLGMFGELGSRRYGGSMAGVGRSIFGM